MSRRSAFAPVPSQPDFVALEHEVLGLWRERRTFARLRAQNAGGERWSFLDGPMTANNPMGVHHAWGRTYKDLFARFQAMLGHDERYQNGFDCQGLWVEVNVERDLEFTSKRDVEAFGVDRFVSLCKQRVLTYAARQTEQSVRLGMWMDWDDPAQLLALRDLLAQDPAQVVTVRGLDDQEVTDSVEGLVGRLGSPELGGSYFTFSDENNYLNWSFLAQCHQRGWLYKGHDVMPWCPRCGAALSQHELDEGYAERTDPGLTVKLPLLDRPGEFLLVWTTTPWTLTANVAAAVRADLRYVRARQGNETYWLAANRATSVLGAGFEVLEERSGAELEGWRYAGPFDGTEALTEAFSATDYRHQVVLWEAVTESEGTGVVHVAPGCGPEDHDLGAALGLPMPSPLDEEGVVLPGFGLFSGCTASELATAVPDALRERGLFYKLEPVSHRYPHCWRCQTPLVYRLVDEWFLRMGPVYDKPRAELTSAELEGSLRYQVMDLVDQVTWKPAFGRERELDWLRNMGDWMVSKKRYWGLTLPFYECAACGTLTVVGGREELKSRARDGWEQFEGHSPHRPWVDMVKVACSGCGEPVSRVADVGSPWLDAGVVPFSTLRYSGDPEYWARWFPADLVAESFPGQFRNWFYALLVMSAVFKGQAPFRTLFGHGLVLAADGAVMHKSSGNSLEFDAAAEEFGADAMRWMFAAARPEADLLFGEKSVASARRRMLVLWNVYSFFATYARLADWTPSAGLALDPSLVRDWPALDRWVLSRTAHLAAALERLLQAYEASAAMAALEGFVEDLSTWYLRRSRERMRPEADPTDRDRAFATLHAVLTTLSRLVAPVVPFLAETMYQNLVVGLNHLAPDSVHLSAWPTEELAEFADPELESAMTLVRRAVDLARTLRASCGLRVRQPLARMWLAAPGAPLSPELLTLVAREVNV